MSTVSKVATGRVERGFAMPRFDGRRVRRSVEAAFPSKDTADDGVSVGQPTWFGPETAPLFGVVHVPSDGRARGGIVLCPPVGKEHVDTYRGMKLLAQNLCERGFAVLRFDYLGTGDSAMPQGADSAIADYQASIQHAVAYLRDSGATRMGLVGLRLGALLAAQAAQITDSLDSLVLWDPVTDGRRFLREQRAIYKMTVGNDVVDVAGESILGINFSAVAAAKVRQMKLPPSIDANTKVLMAVRPDHRSDPRLTDLAAAPNCEVLEVDGHPKFVEPASFVVEIPVDSVSTVTGWLDSVMPGDVDLLVPTIRREAVVAGWGTQLPVVETLDALGDNRLFAIRTSSSHTTEDPPTLLIHNTACEHRVGTGRVWTEGARDLARLGLAVVRYDRRGTGETGVATLEFSRIHSPVSKADVLEAMAATGAAPNRLMMTGVCSGAWHSAYGASHLGAKCVVLMNVILYSHKRVEVGPEKLIRLTPPSGRDKAATEQRTFVRVAKRLIRRWTPYRVWLFLGRHGFTQVPEVLLTQLEQMNVSSDLVLSPQDHDYFHKQHGPRGVSRLARAGWSPNIIPAPTGDHPLLQRDLQNFARERLAEAALREFAADLAIPALDADGAESLKASQPGRG